jgi:hypothetical protein
MGIDPSFAVSIAFKEGSLDPKTIDKFASKHKEEI